MDVSWQNLSEEINLEDYIGFVYKITHLQSKKYYKIGLREGEDPS